MAAKNKHFARYGHECELTNTREELPMYRTGANLWEQIKNSFQRSIMADDQNFKALRFLRSQKNIENERLRHLSFKYMIHPFSEVRQRWENFMVIVFVCIYIIIPLDVACYNFPLQHSISDLLGWKLMRLCVDLILLTDVIINFFTGYWDATHQRVVMNPRKVAVRYCCTYFMPDILSSLPTRVDIFSSGPYVEMAVAVLHMLALLKIFRFFTFMKYCRQMCEVYNIGFLKYRLTVTLLNYSLYFHLLTCISMVVVGRTTTAKQLVQRRRSQPLYIWTEDNRSYNFYGAYARLFRSSTYFATFCFTSGTLINYFPTYVYILIWAFSKVVAFYLIGQLMECVLCARSSNRKYVEIVRELQEFMRHKQLPSSLQQRLLSYYEYKFQKTYFREAEILSIISGQLKQDLILHSCRKLVEDVNFFQNLPTPLIIRIVSVLTTEIYLVNDVITKANTPGDCMYFIASGCVAEYSRSGYEIKHLEDGEYFGEHSLLTREMRVHSCIATETCELYRLDYSDFVKVIMSYPDLVEKIAKHAMDRIEQTDFTEAHSKRRVKVTR